MKIDHNHRQELMPRHAPRGFSLPEVAIAIGIAGMALLALVGLIPGLSDTDRVSGMKSLVPHMASRAMAEIRMMPTPSASQLPLQLQFFFSSSGDMVDDQNHDPLERVFRCDVEIREIIGDFTTNVEDGGIPLVNDKTRLVKMKFTLDAEPKRNSQIVYAGLRH